MKLPGRWDDATRDAWVSVLRNALATSEVVKAPDGWSGWHLAAVQERTTLLVNLWEPGVPRPEGLAVPTPDLAPTIQLMLHFSGSDRISGADLRSPDMRTDEETALTAMTLVAHASQTLFRRLRAESGDRRS